MNLLFDIGHPAHVHLFRCFAVEMQAEGHDILFTCRDKDLTLRLLDEYGLPYVSFGKPKTGMVNKLLGLWRFNRDLLQAARRFRPDVLLSHGSIYAAQCA